MQASASESDAAMRASERLLRTGEDALREVEQAIERGDLDEAARLLNDVERMNAAIRAVTGVDQPY